MRLLLTLAVLAGFYMLAVRLLRYRRRAAIQARHGMRRRSDFGALSADQAQDVLQELAEMEFPKVMGFSIVFALFKTYGIPSVSFLLVATGELSSPETASKRTADTGALILEFCLNKPSSERALTAVARMNYLHSRYIQAGKISNDDLLYTLSLFTLEPIRWIAKYEWRSLSEFECCAQGTFWKALGDKMSIDFSALPSSSSGWQDGLHWLEEVRQWSEQYEKNNMVPAETNHRLALAYVDIVFLNLPQQLKIFGQILVSILVGERVRRAMMLPKAPRVCVLLINGLVYLRQVYLRHFALPRPESARRKYISPEMEKNGRYNMLDYLSHPWYVQPTFTRRWGPGSWATRLLGRKLPGDDDNKYRPEGYHITQLGPAALEDSGHKEMRKDLEFMGGARPGGCPFRP